jgi:HD superfamily phosphohydrolase
VYPSANHTRFEHSIGVSHLAKILIKSLQTHHPELELTDREVELVQIAGLVHDIGHGPFSHLYDDLLVPEGQPKHEERGIAIFIKLVEDYQIPLTPFEVSMITNMINPNDKLKNNYLYQIVANNICSIDVDKIDYIQRDSYHLGFGLSENYERLLTMCRVVDFQGHQTLAWPDKLQDEILSLFQRRYRLHRQVYTHHTVKSIEYPISEILKEILSHFDIIFKLLTDNIIDLPVNETIVKLKEMIDKRQVPKMLGEKVISCHSGQTDTNTIRNLEDKLDMIVTKLNEMEIPNKGWSKIKIGFISGNGKNPLQNVVYFKDLQHPYIEEEYSSFIVPKNCQEYIYRIYANDSSSLIKGKSVWNALINMK